MENIHNILSLFLQRVRKIMGKDLISLPENKIEQIEDALYDEAFDFMMEYGVQISVIVKNEEHFNYWLDILPFYDNVKRERIEIVG